MHFKAVMSYRFRHHQKLLNQMAACFRYTVYSVRFVVASTKHAQGHKLLTFFKQGAPRTPECHIGFKKICNF